MKTPRHPRGDGGTVRPSHADRPSSGERGYDARWRRRRAAFLRDNPSCVLCGKPATVADHYPKSRKQLLAEGVSDPDLPQYLRPLDHRCHSVETAARQPGGWHTPHARRRRPAKKHPGLID